MTLRVGRPAPPEAKALHKLKYPLRSRKLRSVLDSWFGSAGALLRAGRDRDAGGIEY